MVEAVVERDTGPVPGSAAHREEDKVREYVTFRIAEETFAFPMEQVLEIIRVPETVRVPLTPQSLLGLANLRGTVLPILETRPLLGLAETARTDATRVVITDCGKPVGLMVDRVDRVLSVERARIDTTESVSSTVRSDVLTGVVKDHGGGSLLQLLDVHRIVGLEFGSLLEKGDAPSVAASTGATSQEVAAVTHAEEAVQLVSFLVDGQEYALELAQIEEIVRVPEQIRRVPRSEDHVLGLMNLRDRLLPLVSLRRMFRLPEDRLGDRHRVVVANLGREDAAKKECVGIVVDEVREVLSVPLELRDRLPALLERSGRFDELTAVCRLDHGKRLVSVISSDALFQHPAIKDALEQGRDAVEGGPVQATEAVVRREEEEIQLVVFQLANEEFAAPIHTVSEIVRVPDRMTRVPKTPAFIEGMVNLRGTVLPVLDMRTRFELARADKNDRQRILVLDVSGVLTGFIVDSVSEVLRVPRSVIEDSPHMSSAQTKMMGKVANLTKSERMILVLDIEMLLSSEEVGALTEASSS